jgi:hypothetical protein
LLDVLVVLAGLYAPAQSPLACLDYDETKRQLRSTYGEQRIVSGVDFIGRAMEMYFGPAGTWTIIIKMSNGCVQIINAGDNLLLFAPEKEGDPT